MPHTLPLFVGTKDALMSKWWAFAVVSTLSLLILLAPLWILLHIHNPTGFALAVFGISGYILFLAVFVGMYRSRTEKKRLASTFQQILDSIFDMVLVKGPQSRILWGNKAFRDCYGMTNQELRGIVDAPFVEPDYTKQYVHDDEFVFNSGGILNIPVEPVTNHQGETRYFHTVKSPIFDENRRPIMTVGVSRDVTEQKRNESLMQEQQQKLMVASRMAAIGEMAGGLAHEINNPLAVIVARARHLATLCEKPTLDVEKIGTYAKAINVTALHMADVVKGLLTFVRNSENAEMKTVSLQKVFDDTFRLCGERLIHDGIQLQVQDCHDIEIECRPSEITQILLNLIFNAQDAIRALEERWIRISVHRDAHGICIVVTDSGKGIEAEIRNKMMQPFFTTKEVGRGTGLGLSISKGLVEDHGGQLLFDASAPNTAFHIVLPCKTTSRSNQ